MANRTNSSSHSSNIFTTMSDQTELYVVMGILSFLSVMGAAGNALVLYVFAKKKDRLTSTVFILGLAFVDFVTCLIVIPYTIYMEYVRFYVQYDMLCKLYQFLITSNIPFSALIMVAIAIDRYFCICHPFLHAMTLRRAKLMIASLGMFAIGVGIVVALMYGIYAQMPVPGPVRYNPVQSNQNATLVNNLTAIWGDRIMEEDKSIGADEKSYSVNEARELVFHAATNSSQEDLKMLIVRTGKCDQNTIYLDETFQWYYQKFYTAMYLVCLIIVIVLYVLIYRSVLSRRTKRQKQKSKSLPLVQSATNDTNGNSTEETLLTTVNGEASELRNGSSSAKLEGDIIKERLEKPGKSKESKEKDKHRRKSTKKDRNRIANLKTAAMLFVVTVVFIVSFLPAFMMALSLMPHNMTLFYMYFLNNVANPVIYSFMNKNFRDDLKRLFCGR